MYKQDSSEPILVQTGQNNSPNTLYAHLVHRHVLNLTKAASFLPTSLGHNSDRDCEGNLLWYWAAYFNILSRGTKL